MHSQNKYVDILNAAWQAHLAPRSADAPTVISTFAGGGGSSLGYSIAGYRELLAVEWNDNAVEVFRRNFPDVPVYHGDIAALTVDDVLAQTGLQPGELDVFDGSPPCQGFSTSGKRKLDDARNQLFEEYVRLLRGLRPKVFVMENVRGMVTGKMKLIFAEILQELKASGYRVSVRLMNAKYFNVPQSRQRLIFVGVRHDLDVEPSHPKPEAKALTPRQAFVNVRSEEPEDYREMPDWLINAAQYIEAGNYNSRSVVRAFLRTKGTTGGSQNTILLAWDRPSCTLVKNEISACGIIHPSRTRYITVPEAQRISSFPDQFELVGTRKDKIARLGNSVPPLFMAAIGRHIRDTFLTR